MYLMVCMNIFSAVHSANLRLGVTLFNRRITKNTVDSAEGLLAFYLMPKKCNSKAKNYIHNKFD